MNVVSWGQTDVGRKRDHNEDSFVVDPQLGFYMVADGVGGQQAGEVASDMATKIVHNRMKAIGPEIATVKSTQQAAAIQPKVVDSITRAINEASEAIFTQGQTNYSQRGMATTAVVLQIAGTTGVVGHVGDSRLYMIRDGQIYQVTEDHTLLQALLQTGALTPAEAEDFPHKHVIARSVGKSPAVKVDTMIIDVHPGDRFILCSDGLTDLVKPEEIKAEATQRAPESVAQNLINLANQRGGKDNITLIVVEATGEYHTQAVQIRTEQKVNFLKQVFLFRDLSFQEVLRVLTAVREVRFRDGEVIIREGDLGDELFILVEGEVAVYQNGVHLTRIRQGNHFGELALLGDGVRSATVASIGNTVLLTISKRDFYQLVSSDHGLALHLLWGFLQNLTGRMKSLSAELTQMRRSPQR